MGERREQEIRQRLAFEGVEGYCSFGSIPYKIYYNLECSSEDDLIGKKNPGFFLLTPDINSNLEFTGDYSLSLFVHEEVPVEFKDVVAFHELREAELVLVSGLKNMEAHQIAERETQEYAQRYLSNEELAKFNKWQINLFL